MRHALLVFYSCAAVVGLGWAVAQDAPQTEAPGTPPAVQKSDAGPGPALAESPRPDDRRALRGLSGQFAAAYNSGDAPGLAALFAEDAELVAADGSVIEGREAIADRFAATFDDDPGATITIEPESVRFLGDDSALVRGTATLKLADGSTTETTPYSVVYVKQDGHWLHAVVRDEPGGEPTHHERLAELEWMVGEWINESDDAVVSTTCRWADDGSATST